MGKSINIWVNFVGGGWSPWDGFLRGTEEFIREFGKVATEKGYQVKVYHNGTHGYYHGVLYLDHKKFDSDCDILLIVKQADLLDIPLKAKRIIYYTNEIDDKERLIPRRVEKVEKIIALSNWHKNNLLYEIPKVKVVYHGIEEERYKGSEKVKNLCLYASSPDRGLQHLRRFWSEIQKQVPDARLEVAYTGLTEYQMDELYRKADFWLYPCQGVELYCITGIKAQAAGCIPVVVPTMALQETVRHGVKTTLDNFVADTVSIMKDEKRKIEIREKLNKETWPTHRQVFENIVENS